MPRAVIMVGSEADLEFANRICETLRSFGVSFEIRVASAHKVPERVLKILAENEKRGEPLVYITVAGRSNALSGMADANTRYPVIACPPYSEKFAGIDIFSSLRMPSGVAPLVVLEPEAAALAAVKILALADPALGKKISEYQKKMREKIEAADERLRR